MAHLRVAAYLPDYGPVLTQPVQNVVSGLVNDRGFDKSPANKLMYGWA